MMGRWDWVVCVGCLVMWVGAGCESDDGAHGEGEAEQVVGEEVPREEPEHPEFSWEDALGAETSEMREKLGEAEGEQGFACNPQQRLAEGRMGARFSHQAVVLRTGCRHPVSGRESGGGAYRINGARYDGGRAVAVRLKPAEGVEMEAVPSGRFGLPDMERRRRFVLSADGGDRHVEAYRLEERPEAPAAAIGFDVVSKSGEAERVDYINVYSALSELIARAVTLRGPVDGGEVDVVLPETESSLSDNEQLGRRSYVEMAPGSVMVGSLPAYPPLPESERHSGVERVRFSSEDVMESGVVEGAYRDVFAYFSSHDKWVREQLKRGACAGEESPVARRKCIDSQKNSDILTVAVDAATSYETVAEVLGRLKRMNHTRLKMLGKRGGYVVDKKGELTMFNALAAMGQRSYRDYIGVEFRRGGVVVYRSGERVESVEGCSGGLTVCADEGEVSDALERIGAFRREGRREAGQLREATGDLLAAYPWAKLYNVLAGQREEGRGRAVRSVSVSMSGELPASLAYRFADVVRYRRADSSEAETCVDSIEAGGFDDTVRCVQTMGAAERPQRFLPELKLREVDPAWRAPSRPVPSRPPRRRRRLMRNQGASGEASAEMEKGLGQKESKTMDENPLKALGKESLGASSEGDEQAESKREASPEGQSETKGSTESGNEQGREDEFERPGLFVALESGSWRLGAGEDGAKIVAEGEGESAGELGEVRERQVSDLRGLERIELGVGEAVRIEFGLDVRAVEMSGLAAGVYWDGGGEESDDAVYIVGREQGVGWVRVVRGDKRFVDVPVVVE